MKRKVIEERRKKAAKRMEEFGLSKYEAKKHPKLKSKKDKEEKK